MIIMKKYLYIIASLCSIGIPVAGQPGLTSQLNLPRPGDEIIKQQVEYKDPGRSGENVLWDFSRLGNKSEEYVLKYDTLPGGIPVGIEHRTVYRYQFTGDSLLLIGFENAGTLMQSLQPELVRKFPVSFNDSTFTRFHNRGRYGDRLQVDLMGTLDFQADSYGMMVLPNKDTVTNILRIKTVKRVVEDLKPLSFNILRKDTVPPLPASADSIDLRLQTDPLVMETETCQWYAKGYRYPIFETIKNRNIINGESQDYFATAFYYPPQEHYYLDDDPENLALLEENGEPQNPDPWAGLTYNIYPNPVVNDLNIEIYMPKTGQVRMQLVNRPGLVVWTKDFGTWAEGIHETSVFTGGFPTGEYVLNMWFDDYMIGEIIIKK